MGSVTAKPTENFQPHVKYDNNGTDAVLLADDAGNAIIAYGTTVPSDGASGYAIGCLYIHTDGGAGTALYCNEGSATSSDFDAVTVA